MNCYAAKKVCLTTQGKPRPQFPVARGNPSTYHALFSPDTSWNVLADVRKHHRFG